MIRACAAQDIRAIYEIINDAAQAYRGVIPADCWHEPYMPMPELEAAIADGVRFSGYEESGALVGVMGIQERDDVVLIRHAYVRTASRSRGIGAQLLRHLESLARKPILIGTWAAASWAIRFYENHGYRVIARADTPALLRKYWGVPPRQIETSVVLAGRGFA